MSKPELDKDGNYRDIWFLEVESGQVQAVHEVDGKVVEVDKSGGGKAPAVNTKPLPGSRTASGYRDASGLEAAPANDGGKTYRRGKS